MTTKDLMIGDWVQNPLGWKAQVQSIRYVNTIKDEWEWLVKIGINNETFQDHLSLTEIEPIPLTPEILEKNGFSCRGVWCLPGEDLGLRQDGDSWGLLSYYAEYDALAFCHIKYIHQLQHALRLCEIEKEIKL